MSTCPVHPVQNPQQQPPPIRVPRQKPEWQRRYDKEIDQTERWLFNLFFFWVLLLAYVTVDSRGDQLIVSGFFLWTAIGLLGTLAVMTLWEKISSLCE